MNTKIKKRISVVDIIILVALLCAVAAGAFGLLKGLVGSGEKVSVKYVMEISPIDSDLAKKVAEGDGVYDHSSALRIGTVSAVSAPQADYKGYDSQGAVVISPMEGYSTLYVTVETEAFKTGNGYSVNDTLINVGKELSLRFPGLYADAKCVSIDIVE